MSKYYRNLSEDDKVKKRKLEPLERKICQKQTEKEKKYMKNYYYERKTLLDYLISCVWELDSVLNKFLNIMKCFKKFESIRKKQNVMT